MKNKFRKGLKSTLLLTALVLCGCQIGIAERAANVTSGIKNLPSTVFPGAFESTAYIDDDFRIPNASVEPDGEYTVVRTFFATNRSANQEAEPGQMFRDGRGSDVIFGKSYITLKRTGDTLDIEPESLIKVQIVDTPVEDVTLSHNEIFSREDFVDDLDSVINRSDSNDLLIYVHGFNTSFKDAAIRSAQLSYDIGFSGTTVFYSWPSRSDYPAYIADSESAQASQRYLESMITELMFSTSANRVYLVAQSMGARLAARAMKSVFSNQPTIRSRIEELIFLTPDIESGEFANDLAPYLGTLNSPITLYVSGNEPSLVLSRSLNSSSLAGDSSQSVLITRRVETIETGDADVSLATHSSYSDTSSILADIWNLVQNGIRANSRRLLRANYSSDGTYWEYAK